MAGLFSMYAGIAAVVATVRPKGAPGKRSAVWGAVVSLLLAMAAQPVSHLFVTGWLSATPRAPWILVATVSCVPPFILGHLLHLAASPVRPGTSPSVPEDKDTVSWGEDKDGRTVPVPSWVTEDNMSRVLKDIRVPVPVPTEDTKPVPEDKGTRWVFEDKTYRAGVAGVLADAEDKDTVRGQLAEALDVPEDTLAVTPPVSLTKKDKTSGPKDDLSSRRKLTDVIKDIREDVGDDPDAIKDAVLSTPGFEDMRSTPQKRNTLNTAVRRALRKTA
jgi:hypothetical protein